MITLFLFGCSSAPNTTPPPTNTSEAVPEPTQEVTPEVTYKFDPSMLPYESWEYEGEINPDGFYIMLANDLELESGEIGPALTHGYKDTGGINASIRVNGGNIVFIGEQISIIKFDDKVLFEGNARQLFELGIGHKYYDPSVGPALLIKLSDLYNLNR